MRYTYVYDYDPGYRRETAGGFLFAFARAFIITLLLPHIWLGNMGTFHQS